MLEPRAAAFARVFRAEQAAIVAFCFRRVGDHELARDLAAEAFRIAWSRWEEPRRSDRAWLFGVARNLIGNEYRRRSVGLPLQLHEDFDVGDDRATADVVAVDVQLALATLTAAQREVLHLAYWDGLSATEIAEALDTTTAAIWVRLSRARRAFAAAWQEHPPHHTADEARTHP